MKLSVANCPDTNTALRNVVALSPDDRAKLPGEDPVYVDVGGFVYQAVAHDKVASGMVGLSTVQRSQTQVSLEEVVECAPFATPGAKDAVGVMNLDVDFLVKSKSKMGEEVDGKKLVDHILKVFAMQIWSVRQKVLVEFCGNRLLVEVVSISLVEFEEGEVANKAERGLLNKASTIFVQPATNTVLKLVNVPRAPSSLMGPSFNFESMGIGGLDKEFSQIFRRAFASRIFPPEFVKKIGISHVKGMLLYGPPGTGKTLIARQIGKMLNCRPPKIVMGPEVLNKYVGQSEENIRALFAEAEEEYQRVGDDSELHIIIMDELDAICKQRGSSKDSTGVHDTVVNQLLSKIDGVNSLNNILLIGMTNRKDMIDDALLRPGRLEVHVEIGLPDEAGRLQILKIHTAKSRENNVLGDDVDLVELAAQTKNYSGAEIEGLVKSAVAFAFNRHINAQDLNKEIDTDNVKITMEDFRLGLLEIQPSFGASSENLDKHLSGGFIEYNHHITHLHDTVSGLVRQIAGSGRTNLMSVLLQGEAGCGKTALAVRVALDSGCPFVKVVAAEKYVGYSEMSKVQEIQKVFEDAHKSPLSVIVLDDIELLLEYVPIGPRFSNAVLQCIKVMTRKQPPKGRKLLVIGTTSNLHVLEALQLSDSFVATLSVPLLHDPASVKHVLLTTELFTPEAAEACAGMVGDKGIGIKKLLLVCEMSKQGDDKGKGVVTPEAFSDSLRLV